MTTAIPLTPEHWQDLRKSGLTDDTIARAQLHGLCPRDIDRMGDKIKRHATSALVIPYFDMTGKKNGFERRKLFPAVPMDNGHSLRYWQPPKSRVHLYLPPLLDWQALASDATFTLVITEGEKKALAACQYGLPAIGLGGCYNWKLMLDTGEKIVLPTLDLFAWKDRRVELVPDDDAWAAGREFDILAGFYLLGLELIQRGAIVTMVRLPYLPDLRKTGLDDWFLGENSLWRDDWGQLERVALDNVRFHALAQWHQKRQARQATQKALQANELDDLSMTEAAGLYTVTSPRYAVTLTLDRLTDRYNGISAELTVMVGSRELLAGVDLSLKSDKSHATHAQSLNDLAATIPWKLLLQKACTLVLRRHRQGHPVLHLTRHTSVSPLTFTVNPLVLANKPTILFGDGGVGKSSLALFLAMLVSTGRTVAGFSARPGKPLYLDFEDDQDVHTRRLHAIMQGHPELADADVAYQRCVEPLTRTINPLVRQIQAERNTFVILDSLIAATGGDSSAEATTKLFAALRYLNVEILIVGHVPKPHGEPVEHATVYGSVFNQNFARMLWEVQKEQDVGEDVSILGLFNPKSNLTRKHPPIGLKVTHNAENTYLHYEPFNLAQAAELQAKLPLVNRIRNLLEDGKPRTSQEIAEELGAKLGSVKATLSKYNKIKWHMIGEGREAKWTVLNR